MDTEEKKVSGESAGKNEFHGKRNFNGDHKEGGRKPYGHRDGEHNDRKPYSRKKSYSGGKSFDKDKKTYAKKYSDDGEGTEERRSFRKPYSHEDGSGERRSFRKPYSHEEGSEERRSFRKPYSHEESERKGNKDRKPYSEKRSDNAGRSFDGRKHYNRYDRETFSSGNDRRKNERSAIVLDERTEIALQTLIDIEKNGKYINLAFKHNEKLDRLEKKDRAYVMRILYGVTEKSFTIDWLLKKVLEERRVKPWLNAILRIGTYLIYYMRTEDETAIGLSTELCKKYVSEDLAPFVKAVLSKLSEKKDEYNPELYRFKDTSERLSVVYSYPQWLIDMWTRDYGLDTVMTLLDNESERAINLRVSSTANREAVMAGLDEAGIKYSGGQLYNTVTISDTVNIEQLDCYKNGEVTAQGIGSMLTVDCLDVKKNSKVLDCCAAPGGKTFYIAEKTIEDVLSCDIHEHRVELINKGIERLHLENVKTECRDMTEKVEGLEETFDRVLIDAPCSGLGMINSKPDIKNNITEEAINDLAEVQAKLLDTVSSYLKKGGTMIYSTCTVSKKENTDNVNKFLEAHPDFELIDVSDKLPDNINYINDGKTILILPSKYNSDAFFISVMHRN